MKRRETNEEQNDHGIPSRTNDSDNNLTVRSTTTSETYSQQ